MILRNIFRILFPRNVKNNYVINLTLFQRIHSNQYLTFLGHISIRNNTLIRKNISSRLLLKSSIRNHSGKSENYRNNATAVFYVASIGIFMVGLSYTAVPLYRMFCQATGLGGQAVHSDGSNKIESLVINRHRKFKIKFNADTASSMQWSFHPQQSEINIVPGETALAFYTAKNPTNKPIIGISTYNVIPFEAGQYFNKIQCFCFEEQRLNSNEQVDMPVFFYIDPDIVDDPKLENISTIILSYTFFEAKEGLKIPVPSYATNVH